MSWSTDPTQLFQTWFAEGVATEPRVPEAMQLATVSTDGRPGLRTVLLKELDAQGLVFYTNYGSRKARELDGSGYATALFHFKGLERQIIAEGRVERVPEAMSDAYHASRPRGSQIGAWASSQSAPTAGRDALLAEVERQTERFEGRDVPRPPHWGGYRLVPDRWEFWQGHPDRLHERWELTPDGEGGWTGRWLQP
ncbi:MAG: pyridoxamine 5'-phosphate oxidase [Deltaproteobacteria bacterium]|nr:MAG: pyridoxamine 5'-phosphate oxidase [Deltaproteobacteria bacterium]